MKSIRAWHGSQRWSGQATLQVPRKGAYECGPGIYATTGLATAVRYAKGGGKVMLFEIDSKVGLAEDSRLPIGEMKACALRLRNGRKVAADLDYSMRKQIAGGGEIDTLPVNYLINLAVNHDALGGKSGIYLASWLAQAGIGASVHARSGREDWVVIFDPSAIISATPVSPAEMDWSNAYMPKIRDQISDRGPDLAAGESNGTTLAGTNLSAF
jgi:hypothetical protein